MIGLFTNLNVNAYDYVLVNTLPGTPYGPNLTFNEASNFGSTTPHNALSSVGDKVAQSFETVTFSPQLPGPYSITALSLNLFNIDLVATSTFDVGIYTNTAGGSAANDAPNIATGLVSQIATNVSLTSSNRNNVVTFNGLDIGLNTSTQTKYWVVISLNSTSGGSSGLSYGFGSTTSNASDYFSGATPYTTSGSSTFLTSAVNSPLLMSMTVPEPSTYALGCISVIALGYVGRKRRKAQVVTENESKLPTE